MAFKKGNIPYNKGKKMTEEQKLKVSESKKGNIPWNKGKKGVQKAWNKGISTPNKTKGIKREHLKGENNPHWKGGHTLFRIRHLAKKYNMTIEEYLSMLEGQGNKCKICRKECVTGQTLSIDHDHHTNEIRGLLCRKCNSGLGMFNDSSELVEKALEYLKFYK